MLGRLLRKLFAEGMPVRDERARLVEEGVTAFRDLDYAAACNFLLEANSIHALDADGYRVLGTSLLYSGRLDEAEGALRMALDLHPENAEVQNMLAMKHLLAGNWIEGFRRYEACRNGLVLQMPDQRKNREWLHCIYHSLQGIPLWRGEPLDGKRLVLWSEYGHGDAIMNMRFIPVLQERYRPKEVIFVSVAAEECLFGATGGQRFFEAEWEWRPTPGDFDCHCSIISLPYHLKVSVDDVPGRVPYMFVPAAKKERWHDRLAEYSDLRVGLSWAGNPEMRLDRLRSLSLEQLGPLFGLKGVRYFSLQKDQASRSAMAAKRLPAVDLMDECEDFIDTAALIENLDLVISVDSALAHLTGAIGKPIWMLNRFESEWRWMRDREDTPWYPSMRIFSQKEPRNWAPVIAKVASDLSALAAGAGRANG